MVYLIGTLGFLAGFFLGQMILLRLLRDVPKEELTAHKNRYWQYGVLNWLVAILTAAASVWLYNNYFL